jgi:hypothetical protein
MTHKAKIDWWIAAALALGVFAPLAFGNLWITMPLFLAVGICGYPQHYRTAAEGLEISSGLIRRTVPYQAITFVGPSEEGGSGFPLSPERVGIRYGMNAGVLLSPEDTRAFIADIAARAPQLTRRGQDLVLACAQGFGPAT